MRPIQGLIILVNMDSKEALKIKYKWKGAPFPILEGTKYRLSTQKFPFKFPLLILSPLGNPKVPTLTFMVINSNAEFGSSISSLILMLERSYHKYLLRTQTLENWGGFCTRVSPSSSSCLTWTLLMLAILIPIWMQVNMDLD